MSRRESEILQELSYQELFGLGNSITDKPVRSEANKSDLVKTIRNSASIEEIEKDKWD